MPFSAIDILLGMLLPAVVCLVVGLIISRLAGRASGQPDATDVVPTVDAPARYAAVAGLLCAFLAGCFSLQLVPLEPTTHWHWLIYTVAVSVLTGAITAAAGVGAWERVTLTIVVFLLASLVLIPDWDELSEQRIGYIGVFVVYTTIVSELLWGLCDRVRPIELSLAMWFSLIAGGVVLALAGSLRFAQIGLCGGAAFFAVAVLCWASASRLEVKPIAPVFTMLTAGLLLIGKLQSFGEIPLIAFAIVPLAPLGLWAIMLLPTAKRSGASRWLVAIAIPCLILAVAVGIAAVTELSGADGY